MTVSYVSRAARTADLGAVSSLCQQAQATYWQGIKTPRPEAITAGLLDKAIVIVCESGGQIIGSLIARFLLNDDPRMVLVAGITLPKEPARVAASMLLYLCDLALANGVKVGIGEVEATNAPAIAVLRAVGVTFTTVGRDPRTGQDHILRGELRIDAALRAKLARAVG